MSFDPAPSGVIRGTTAITSKMPSLKRKARVICEQTPRQRQQRVGKNPGIRRGKAGVGNHRGFWFIKRRDSLRFDHCLWRMFPGTPKTFLWHGDLEQAKLYVDAWYAKDRKSTIKAEQDGLATDVVLPLPSEFEATQYEKVNVKRLVAALSLTDAFDVPLWEHVDFVTDGHNLVPCDYIATLIALDPAKFGHLDPTKQWVRAIPSHLVQMGLRPEQVTSGMYLKRQAAAAAPAPMAAGAPAPTTDSGDDAPPPTPPRERTLLRRDRVDYIEWVTEIIPDDQPPYFCRRLYRDQQMLYEATSYNRNGPWTVYSRDNNALLALGVDP